MKKNVKWKDFPTPTTFTTETEVRVSNEISDHPLILTSAKYYVSWLQMMVTLIIDVSWL